MPDLDAVAVQNGCRPPCTSSGAATRTGAAARGSAFALVFADEATKT